MLLKVAEVADRLRVSRLTVVSWIRSGLLAAIDVAPAGATNRQYRVNEADLAAFERLRSTKRASSSISASAVSARSIVRAELAKISAKNCGQSVR